MIVSCTHDGYKESLKSEIDAVNILFLHHSTGNNISKGTTAEGKADAIVWL